MRKKEMEDKGGINHPLFAMDEIKIERNRRDVVLKIAQYHSAMILHEALKEAGVLIDADGLYSAIKAFVLSNSVEVTTINVGE